MFNVHYDTSDQVNDAGLVQVGELDEEGLSYEYHTLLVVQHVESKRVFYAEDSGCSCPTPFEDYHFHSPDETNMTEVTQGDSFISFERDVTNFPAPEKYRQELIDKVKKLVNKKVWIGRA